MEMTWLYALPGTDVFIVVTLAALVFHGLELRRTRLGVKKELDLAILETTEIRATLLALQTEVVEMKKAAATSAPPAKAFVPGPVLTADQRAGALQMLRNGADADSVCDAMRLSRPEATLLRKVQTLMDSACSAN